MAAVAVGTGTWGGTELELKSQKSKSGCHLIYDGAAEAFSVYRGEESRGKPAQSKATAEPPPKAAGDQESGSKEQGIPTAIPSSEAVGGVAQKEGSITRRKRLMASAEAKLLAKDLAKAKAARAPAAAAKEESCSEEQGIRKISQRSSAASTAETRARLSSGVGRRSGIPMERGCMGRVIASPAIGRRTQS